MIPTTPRKTPAYRVELSLVNPTLNLLGDSHSILIGILHCDADDIHGAVKDHCWATDLELVTSPSNEQDPLQKSVMNHSVIINTYHNTNGIWWKSHELGLCNIVAETLSKNDWEKVREGIERDILQRDQQLSRSRNQEPTLNMIRAAYSQTFQSFNSPNIFQKVKCSVSAKPLSRSIRAIMIATSSAVKAGGIPNLFFFQAKFCD